MVVSSAISANLATVSGVVDDDSGRAVVVRGTPALTWSPSAGSTLSAVLVLTVSLVAAFCPSSSRVSSVVVEVDVWLTPGAIVDSVGVCFGLVSGEHVVGLQS